MRTIYLLTIFVLLTACTGCDNNEEAFSDPAFKACVEESLRDYSEIEGQKYSITNEKDLEVIKMISCGSSGIVSIKGVEKLVNVQTLAFTTNQIESVESIRQLRKLEVLHLDFNKIRKVEPLSGATSLRTLILSENYISDISMLTTLTQMEHLYTANNCISDASQYENLEEALPELNIYGKEYQSAEKCQ